MSNTVHLWVIAVLCSYRIGWWPPHSSATKSPPATSDVPASRGVPCALGPASRLQPLPDPRARPAAREHDRGFDRIVGSQRFTNSTGVKGQAAVCSPKGLQSRATPPDAGRRPQTPPQSSIHVGTISTWNFNQPPTWRLVRFKCYHEILYNGVGVLARHRPTPVTS